MATKKRPRSKNRMGGTLQARIEAELLTWLEAEADRLDESISEAARRHLWAAKLSSDAAKMRSDQELGVGTREGVDPENPLGSTVEIHNAETLAGMMRRGQLSPDDVGDQADDEE